MAGQNQTRGIGAQMANAPQGDTPKNRFEILFGKPSFVPSRSTDVLELKTKRGGTEILTGYQKTLCDVHFPDFGGGLAVQTGYRVAIRANAAKQGEHYVFMAPRPSFQGAKPYMEIRAEYADDFKAWQDGIIRAAEKWYTETPASERIAVSSRNQGEVLAADTSKLGIKF